LVGAVRPSRIFDDAGRVVALLGLSMRPSCLGCRLLLLLAGKLGWFPVISTPQPGFFGRLHAVFLPALSVGLVQASFILRSVRSSLLEVLQEDYIRTAHAQGVPPARIHYWHALRNAPIPVITVFGQI